MMHPIAIYFFSVIVISLWCAGFRKLVSYTKTITRVVKSGEDQPTKVPIYSNQMLLWSLGVKLDAVGWWGKPLGSCIACMPSVHGTILYWGICYFFAHESPILVPMWIVVVVTCAFTSTLAYGLIRNQ